MGKSCKMSSGSKSRVEAAVPSSPTCHPSRSTVHARLYRAGAFPVFMTAMEKETEVPGSAAMGSPLGSKVPETPTRTSSTRPTLTVKRCVWETKGWSV